MERSKSSVIQIQWSEGGRNTSTFQKTGTSKRDEQMAEVLGEQLQLQRAAFQKHMADSQMSYVKVVGEQLGEVVDNQPARSAGEEISRSVCCAGIVRCCDGYCPCCPCAALIHCCGPTVVVGGLLAGVVYGATRSSSTTGGGTTTKDDGGKEKSSTTPPVSANFAAGAAEALIDGYRGEAMGKAEELDNTLNSMHLKTRVGKEHRFREKVAKIFESLEYFLKVQKTESAPVCTCENGCARCNCNSFCDGMKASGDATGKVGCCCVSVRYFRGVTGYTR